MRLLCLVAIAAAEPACGLDKCDLGRGGKTLSDELRRRGSRCHAFAPLGKRPASASIRRPGRQARNEREVCIRALSQSGSTWTEAVVAEILKQTCATRPDCTFAWDEATSTASVRWRAGVIYASYGRTPNCDCTKHRPVRQDQPACANLIVLRDSRSRQASHFRYRRLVVRGQLPPRASVWAVAAQQDRETARLRRLFIGGYDAGGNASALPFRYELLASPAGPTILRDIDAYLGLPRLRGAPLSLRASQAVLAAQSKNTLARKCRDGTGTYNVSLPGCPAERSIQLFRTHESVPLDTLLGGAPGRARVDSALASHPLLRAMWGCFVPPRCASDGVLRPTRAACPPTVHQPTNPR